MYHLVIQLPESLMISHVHTASLPSLLHTQCTDDAPHTHTHTWTRWAPVSMPGARSQCQSQSHGGRERRMMGGWYQFVFSPLRDARRSVAVCLNDDNLPKQNKCFIDPLADSPQQGNTHTDYTCGHTHAHSHTFKYTVYEASQHWSPSAPLCHPLLCTKQSQRPETESSTLFGTIAWHF